MGGVQERLPPDQAFGIFLATFLNVLQTIGSHITTQLVVFDSYLP